MAVFSLIDRETENKIKQPSVEEIKKDMVVKKINIWFLNIRSIYDFIIKQEKLDFVRTKDFCNEALEYIKKIESLASALYPEYDRVSVHLEDLNNFLTRKETKVRILYDSMFDTKDTMFVYFEPKEKEGEK